MKHEKRDVVRCSYKNISFEAVPLGTEFYRVTITQGPSVEVVEMERDAFAIIAQSCKQSTKRRKKRPKLAVINGL